VHGKVRVPIENLEHDIKILEGNLQMSGKVINRLRVSINRMQGGIPLNSTSVDDIPALLSYKSISKTDTLTDLQERRYHAKPSKTIDEVIRVKPADKVDDGCVFSRVKSWKSTDVKVHVFYVML